MPRESVLFFRHERKGESKMKENLRGRANALAVCAKWFQVAVGLYSLVYMPLALSLILNSASVKLPVLNFLPEYFVWLQMFTTPHLDLLVLIAILMLSFVFFGAFSVGSKKVVFSVVAACYYLADLVAATLFMALKYDVYSQFTVFSIYMIIPALVCDAAALVLHMVCIRRKLLYKSEAQCRQYV